MVGDVAPEIPLPVTVNSGSTSTVLRISWEEVMPEFSSVFYVLQYNLSKPDGTAVSGEIMVCFCFVPSPFCPLLSDSLSVIHTCTCSFCSPLDYEHNGDPARPDFLH